MAGDFGLFINEETGVIEPLFEDGDYVEDMTLETAVILSLFSDARIEVDELPLGETKRRGFWGDLFADVEGDVYGSKLWLYDRGKIANSQIPLVENKAAAALEWLIEDGAAKSVETEASFESGKLRLDITIQKPDGDENRFGFIWNEQEIRRA